MKLLIVLSIIAFAIVVSIKLVPAMQTEGGAKVPKQIEEDGSEKRRNRRKLERMKS